jgi:hypothetical protein
LRLILSRRRGTFFNGETIEKPLALALGRTHFLRVFEEGSTLNPVDVRDFRAPAR